MKQDKIIIMSLVLTLLLSVGFLVRKMTHRAPLGLTRVAVEGTNQVRMMPQRRVFKSSVSPTGVKVTKKTIPARRFASNQKISRPSSPSLKPQRLATRSSNRSIRLYVPPSRGSSQNDEGREMSQEIADLNYQERQEVEFLKMKVGLNEAQIRTMEQKRSDYLTQLKLFSLQERQGFKNAGADKRVLIKSHIQWMSDYLGTENYYEFLNLTVR